MSSLPGLLIPFLVMGLIFALISSFGWWRASHAADELRQPSRNGCAARRLLSVEAPADRAVDVVLQSFESIGAKPNATVRPEQVCAARGLNVRTWGEILTAWIVPTSDTTTDIRVESCPSVPFTMADWGRNRANVAKLAEQITARVALVDGRTGESLGGAITEERPQRNDA